MRGFVPQMPWGLFRRPQGRESGKVDVWRAMGPAAWAESEWVMEDGNPIVLAPWQMALAMSVR